MKVRKTSIEERERFLCQIEQIERRWGRRIGTPFGETVRQIERKRRWGRRIGTPFGETVRQIERFMPN